MVYLLLGALAFLAVLLVLVALRQTDAYRFTHELLELNESIEDERSPVELGRQLLTAVSQKTKASAALLYIQQEGVAALRLKASCNLSQSELGELASEPGIRRGLLDRVERDGSVLIRVNQDQQTGFLAKYRSILAISLEHDGRLGGVIVLLQKAGFFTARHLRLLGRFAGRAAVALENARRYQENRTAAEENARLYLNLSKLYRQATVDNLSGLHNRSYMQQRLREEIKKAWRFKQPLALVLVDLDHFHRINEAQGQEAGDEVLRSTARVVRETARDYDIICRYGGEEILLILPQTETEGAAALAERIRQQVEAKDLAAGHHLTCSAGVVAMISAALPPAVARRKGADPILDRTAESLMSQVEETMERAKEAGRNRIEISAPFDPSGLVTTDSETS